MLPKANSLINLIYNLDGKGKQNLSLQFDKWHTSGDYNSIVLELAKFFNTQFLKDSFIPKNDPLSGESEQPNPKKESEH